MANYLLYKSIYKKKNIFSIYYTYNMILLLFKYYKISLLKYWDTSVNYLGRKALELRYIINIQILLLGQLSYIRFSKALCREGGLIRPDNISLYLRSLFQVFSYLYKIYLLIWLGKKRFCYSYIVMIRFFLEYYNKYFPTSLYAF